MGGLVIAGFHRSGTSSVAQHLAQSGLHLGHDLIGSNDFNPYGHFEDWPPVRFHNNLMARAGLDWASTEEREMPVAQADRDWIAKYCSNRARTAQSWGFKDPRSGLFLEEWSSAAPDLKFVLIYRDPTACAWSLYRREIAELVQGTGEPVEHRRFLDNSDHALRLWALHARRQIAFAERHPERCLVVGHAAFLNGFNIAEAVENRFSLGLSPAPVDATLDPQAVTRKTTVLPVFDDALREEVPDLWRKFQALDISADQGHSAPAGTLSIDPSGETLQIHLMRIMTDFLLDHCETLKTANADLENRRRGHKKLTKKLNQFPFNLYFRHHKTFGKLLQDD